MATLPIITREEVPEAEYRSFMERMPIVAVDIIFLNPNRTKVLLGRRSSHPYKGEWFAFGGRLLKNESPVDGAIRQAAHEAGISVSPSSISFAGVYNEVSGDSKYPGVNYHAVVLLFWCIIEEVTPTLDSQHSEAAWIALDDPSLHTRTKDRITTVLRSMKNPTI